MKKLRMKVTWALVMLAYRLKGRKLTQCEFGHPSDYSHIEIVTTINTTYHRLGYIQETDRLLRNIQTILYCFNFKPHKLMSQYHEIGVPFSIDGTTLVAIEHSGNCETCYCRGDDHAELCEKLNCLSTHRKDGKSVIFSEILPK